MAFKLSLEIDNDNVTLSAKKGFLKVLYNVCRIKKKHIDFEQYARLHIDGPKITICETTSDTLFIVDTSFTTKDDYFRHALAEVCDALNATLRDFAYTQKLERYDPRQHQYHEPQKHPFHG